LLVVFGSHRCLHFARCWVVAVLFVLGQALVVVVVVSLLVFPVFCLCWVRLLRSVLMFRQSIQAFWWLA
jgi:hypothetical protein